MITVVVSSNRLAVVIVGRQCLLCVVRQWHGIYLWLKKVGNFSKFFQEKVLTQGSPGSGHHLVIPKGKVPGPRKFKLAQRKLGLLVTLEKGQRA